MRLMVSPRPEPHDLRKVRRAYDMVAEDYAASLPDTRAETPLDLAMVEAFVSMVTLGGDGRVLDAGCGAGRMSAYLAGRGCLVEGIDLSSKMIAMARRDHPDLAFTVGSLADLPFRENQFDGVMLWYSIIHTPATGLAQIFAEAARVLRPGGYVVLGFQSGDGLRDLSQSYRRFGHEVQLERHLHATAQVVTRAESAGLHEVCRLVRRAQGSERDDQAFVIAKADGGAS